MRLGGVEQIMYHMLLVAWVVLPSEPFILRIGYRTFGKKFKTDFPNPSYQTITFLQYSTRLGNDFLKVGKEDPNLLEFFLGVQRNCL